MLGNATLGTGYILSYETAGDRITVWYGGVKRRTDSSCQWKLPADTVLSFVYAPKKQLSLSELGVDLSKFRKQREPELVNDFHYYNPAEGLTLTTRIIEGEEMLLSVERDPKQELRAKYCEQLTPKILEYSALPRDPGAGSGHHKLMAGGRFVFERI